MTSTPLARAFWIAGTIALVSLGVIMMPLTPAATMFSIAVTWLALSPSNLPAALVSVAPLADASFWAPSFILTKNGLVSVLVIRPTFTLPEPLDDEPLEPPQAVIAIVAATATASRPAALRDVPDISASLGLAGQLDRGGGSCVNDVACAIVVMRQRCRTLSPGRNIDVKSCIEICPNGRCHRGGDSMIGCANGKRGGRHDRGMRRGIDRSRSGRPDRAG